jgi:hypothetical protein
MNLKLKIEIRELNKNNSLGHHLVIYKIEISYIFVHLRLNDDPKYICNIYYFNILKNRIKREW